MGDELMADWRSRTKGSSVRLRAYVDVHPSADSRLTLDQAKKNRYGDPMPKIVHRVDAATEATIQDALQKLIADRTSLIIAHRLSTVRNVDRILVLHHGRLVEQGSHTELLARGGTYARLYELQYREQEPAGSAAAPACR